MKAIKQLAVHFWRKGVISPLEAAYLVRHGFVRERDLPGFTGRPEVAPEPPPAPIEPPSPLEEVEASLEARPARRRRGKAATAEEVGPEALCARLEDEFARRAPVLRALAVLAKAAGVKEVGDWRAAATALRGVDDAALRQALQAARRRGLRPAALADALDLGPFQRVADGALPGRAAQALRALLADPSPAAIGKYGWVLRFAPARAVRNLVVLRERLGQL